MDDTQQVQGDKRALRRAYGPPPGAGQSEGAPLCGARAALFARPLLHGRRRVALYCAMPGEVDTAPLAQALWQDSVQLYLPKTVGRGRQATLAFVPYAADTPLRRHAGGMLEPRAGGEEGEIEAGTHAASVDAHALDAVVVPGVAFDLRGGRLGRGWGCYDRALAGFVGLVVALAHAHQLAAHLPREAHDCGVDAIVIPTGVVPCGWRRDRGARPTA